MKFATKAIHAGIEPDAATGAVMTPIYQTSTFAQPSPGRHKGYTYARSHNPTRTALQASIAALENGKHGLCFASGMAATDAVLRLLRPGDEVIACQDLYGGTYRLMKRLYEPYGLTFRFVELTNANNLEAAITPATKLVWIETPTNPLLYLVDIQAIAAIAKAHHLLLAVDNTFASPYLQTPMDMGADIVMHSATKYLGGHSDVVMGALVVNRDDLAKQLGFIQNTAGAVPGPQDCFLVLRGIKTLALRMRQHSENGLRIAQYLQRHPAVGRVYYPGLPDKPQYELARRQMRDFGGMISFELKGDRMDDAVRVMENLKLFALAESLGGVESLCAHPASMSHASIPPDKRAQLGIKDTLIRLSVGIEDADDLIDDLAQAIGLF